MSVRQYIVVKALREQFVVKSRTRCIVLSKILHRLPIFVVMSAQDFNIWESEVRKKEKAYEEEKYVVACRYMLSVTCNDEDDHIPLGDIIARNSTSKAITPDLPIQEPDNSLKMGDEHLDTIPATESDEVLKSSVENLVPFHGCYSELKVEALRNKAIIEGLIDEDAESSNNGWRRWDSYEIADHDQEEREYENGHEDKERCELFDDHEFPVCNIRRFEMIKYSFRDDEEYIAVKEDKYDEFMNTSKEAIHAYREIFRMMDGN
ncbi:hypothetical protein Tco_0821450 [Tanacetum coccineum]|uniref:Uncharacterized protein n=1 Tax=Tanacetum coccineum TaxID=301880 RepID=A0ABQ5AD63_9ASTR